MRLIAVTVLALVGIVGCVSLQARIPEDVVRRHAALEEGIELGAMCSLDGRTYSEGAVACMAGGAMVCDPTGRWARSEAGDC